MENNQNLNSEKFNVFNKSQGKFFFYSGISTKAFSAIPWNLLIVIIAMIFLADLVLVLVTSFSLPETSNTFVAVSLLVVFYVVTAPLLAYVVYWDFLILAKKITNNAILCVPNTLILGEDNLKLTFTVSEIVGLTNLKRNLGRSKIQQLTSILDYGYVKYSYIVSKKDIRNVIFNSHLCTIEGDSLLYLPKCFYDDTGIKIDPYHIAMHDKCLSDEDRKNRDSQYPWIIKKNKFSFVFAFKEKDAEQVILEWANQKVARP